MTKKLIPLSLCLLALSACATPPDSAQLANLPVVEFGNPVPGGDKFILHFPAGKTIATDVEISGNLLVKPARQVLKVKLKQDIYSYKQWVSYDKQHWVKAHDTLAFKLAAKIPGYQFPHPGYIKLDISKKH